MKIRSLPVLPLEVQVIYGSPRFWRPTILGIVHNASLPSLPPSLSLSHSTVYMCAFPTQIQAEMLGFFVVHIPQESQCDFACFHPSRIRIDPVSSLYPPHDCVHLVSPVSTRFPFPCVHPVSTKCTPSFKRVSTW